MKRKAQKKPATQKESLAIRAGNDAPLSKTQVEFNRLMKSLESTKASHAKEQARLDEALEISIKELMPLIESLNRVNRDIILGGFKALRSLKLTARRHHSFGDLLSGKAEDLVADPVGLAEGEIAELQAIIDELGPSEEELRMQDEEEEKFDFLCDMLEQTARAAGVELDLSDLDPSGDPMEFERTVRERLGDAAALFDETPPAAKRPRKQTKAQAEKERKRQEMEDAKSRDLKSLFKQLAKAFHPDLEPDPLLKEHKKVRMQRLNTAYAASDLREMLQLEMEWLGEEATNLATAGDEKLKVYCLVLKEQIADFKAKFHELRFEPQYGPLQRFIDPYYGTLSSPKTIKRELRGELDRHHEMLGILARNDANSRRMIYAWADEHARRASIPF